MPDTFDAVATRYDEELNSGLKWTGEGPGYYVDGRVALVTERLQAIGHDARCVLDFGCGTGNAVERLSQALGVQSLVGLDPSTDSLRVAEQRYDDPRIRWTESGDCIAEQSIDYVYTSGVFHHIEPTERQPTLERIFRWMRPGATLSLFENNPWNPATRFVMSRIPFDRDAICLPPPETRRRLAKAGFQVEETSFLFFFPGPLRALRPAERLLRSLPLGAQYVVWARRP